MRSILIIFFILAILVFPWLLLNGEKPSSNNSSVSELSAPIQIIQAKESSSILYQSAGPLPYSVSFGNKKEPAQAPTKLEVSNKSITTIPETKIKEIKKEGGNKVTIIASDGTKFIQTLQKTGIKEEIVLQEPVLEIAFKMNLEGLTPKKVNGLWRFFDQTEQELFYIPKPFMVDKKGARSENVEIIIKDAIIKIIPDTAWLADPNRVYPVIIDPSFILNILNVHSHPQAGDNWTVSFETIGKADLTITPEDQATIDDIDFVSLKCGGSTSDGGAPSGDDSSEVKNYVQPQILDNDIIFYPDWSCDTTAEIVHLVDVAAPHTLKFQFGDQIAYAYNNPDSEMCESCTCSGTGYESITCSGNTVYVDCNYDYCWAPTTSKKWDDGESIIDGDGTCTISDGECDENDPDCDACYHCANLNYGGSTDWFLSNRGTLVSLCQSDSCDGTCFGGDGAAVRYWARGWWFSDNAYRVFFSGCGIGGTTITEELNIRCTHYGITFPPTVCVIDDSSQPGQLTVKWQDTNSAETNYRVERNADSAGWSFLVDAGANSTYYDDTSTASDHTYQYRIRAEKNGTNSDWCTTAVVDLSIGGFRFEGVKMEGVKIN